MIGDKWSVGTARQFIKLKPEKIEEFARVLKVPIKFIHVYRNPFDSIATMTLREANQRFNAEKSGYKVIKLYCTLKYNELKEKINHSQKPVMEDINFLCAQNLSGTWAWMNIFARIN